MIILADMYSLRLCICLFHGVRTYHYVRPFHTIVSAQSIYRNCHNFDIISKYYTCTIKDLVQQDGKLLQICVIKRLQRTW